MNDADFFIRRVDELRRRGISSDPYEQLLAAVPLRQLLLEGLIHKVNRDLKIQLVFRVMQPSPAFQKMMLQGAHTSSMADMLDPDIRPFPGFKPVDLTFDQFLAYKISKGPSGEEPTVKDVIRFVANAMGAVHRGDPKDSKQKALKDIDDLVAALDRLTRDAIPPVLRGPEGISVACIQIRTISRIVAKAVEPIEAALRTQS